MVIGFKSSRALELEADERIHDKLTSIARERIARTLLDRFKRDEFKAATKDALRAESSERFHDQFVYLGSSPDAFWEFFDEAEDEEIHSFLEYLLTHVHKIGGPNRHKELTKAYEEVKDIFASEGILYELYVPEPGEYRIKEISSDEFIESDEETVKKLESEEWDKARSAYSKAREKYIDGDYSTQMFENLSVAMEEVLKTIVVDLEDLSTDRDKSSGYYIQKLKEEDFFYENSIMEEEINHIIEAVDRLRNKVEGDRKRHRDLSREYCTLVLHQTSAYISFLIQRYENEF